jgi:hypothetical protein
MTFLKVLLCEVSEFITVLLEQKISRYSWQKVDKELGWYMWCGLCL